MIIMSMAAALLSTMNIWTATPGHMRLHLNDIYMALLMTGWMIFFDSLYHYNHYQNIFIPIISFCFILFVIYLIRKQTFINDRQFIKGMIPHHSMAILMAEKIKEKTKDKKIMELADNIIQSQNKEIALMEQYELNNS